MEPVLETNEASVIAEKKNGVGWITLNRPRAINSLNADMAEGIFAALTSWLADDGVRLVVIAGAGEKGFCAGGDMRAMHRLRDNGIESYAERFFTVEYEADDLIHRYPKPVLAYMDGIVMGGGVGLSVGASHRVVTETTKWAMPEMNIGFFPDVGASYFLNRFPEGIGRYLALTADVIRSEDALFVGAADYLVSRERWSEAKASILEEDWFAGDAAVKLDRLLRRYAEPASAPSRLARDHEAIRKHFRFDAVEEIFSSLERDASDGDEWAARTLQGLAEKSPLSLKAALSQLRRGSGLSLQDCLAMELNLAMNFMSCHDFYEGVRAVLVDKDRNPVWKPADLGGVAEERVSSLFRYDWKQGVNPLAARFASAQS